MIDKMCEKEVDLEARKASRRLSLAGGISVVLIYSLFFFIYSLVGGWDKCCFNLLAFFLHLLTRWRVGYISCSGNHTLCLSVTGGWDCRFLSTE